MRTREAFLLTIAVLVSGCSAMATGERFVQPPPTPSAEWRGEIGDYKGNDAVQYTRTGTGDVILSAIMGTMDGFPASEFRSTFDESLKLCESGDSLLLDDTPINGFPRVIWRTQCRLKDGATRTQVILYITGRDAGFYAYHLWAADQHPDAAAIDTWKRYFQNVVPCDDRPERSAPCPALPAGNSPLEVPFGS